MGLVKSIEENTADVFGDIGLMNCEPVKTEHTNNTRSRWPPVALVLDDLAEK